MIKLDEGSIKNVGAPTRSGTAKLYELDTVGCNCFKIFATPGSQNSLRTYSRQYDDAEARAFGDERVKLGFDDGEGNEVGVSPAGENDVLD